MKDYTYKLEKDQNYGGFIVIEYINENKNAIWTLDYVVNYNEESTQIDSLIEIPLAAKYWLMKNHPEFLI